VFIVVKKSWLLTKIDERLLLYDFPCERQSFDFQSVPNQERKKDFYPQIRQD